MGTLQRIKEFIDIKGITIKAFEESVGFSNGAFGSQLRNNKTIGVDKIENILFCYPELSPEWLLTGNGPMLKSNASAPDQNQTADVTIDKLIKEVKELSVENALLKIENEKLKKDVKHKSDPRTHTAMVTEP